MSPRVCLWVMTRPFSLAVKLTGRPSKLCSAQAEGGSEGGSEGGGGSGSEGGTGPGGGVGTGDGTSSTALGMSLASGTLFTFVFFALAAFNCVSLAALIALLDFFLFIVPLSRMKRKVMFVSWRNNLVGWFASMLLIELTQQFR